MTQGGSVPTAPDGSPPSWAEPEHPGREWFIPINSNRNQQIFRELRDRLDDPEGTV